MCVLCYPRGSKGLRKAKTCQLWLWMQNISISFEHKWRQNSCFADQKWGLFRKLKRIYHHFKSPNFCPKSQNMTSFEDMLIIFHELPKLFAKGSRAYMSDANVWQGGKRMTYKQLESFFLSFGAYSDYKGKDAKLCFIFFPPLYLVIRGKWFDRGNPLSYNPKVDVSQHLVLLSLIKETQFKYSRWCFFREFPPGIWQESLA